MAGQRRTSGPARKRPPARGGKKPSRLKRVVRALLVVGVVLGLLGALAVVIVYRAIPIPDPNKAFETETTHVYYADKKTEIGQFAMQKRDRIPYSEMPQSIKDAVVAAEDRTFWTNPGIDIKGIIRAGLSNASGNSTQGASTITQQYVKILYLTQERTYKRKIKEAVVARKVAKSRTKDQVLEGYLNTIYFGRGAYGIQAAAVTWFGKSAKDLSIAEAAVLASVINNPTQFDPANGEANAEALHRRMKHVLNGMVEMDKLDAATASEAGASLPTFAKQRTRSTLSGQRGHALALVRSELVRLGVATEAQIDGGGLKVYTTLSRKVMRAAEEGALEVRPEGLKPLHAAVASVQPGTGALRGFYAGQDYLESQINWALAGGMVGSTFKPFALAAGLEAGFSLKDTFDGNSPFYYNREGTGTFVVNEDAGYDHGRVNLIKATEKSINSAFADLTVSIPGEGEAVMEVAQRLGIPPEGGAGNNNLHKSPGLKPFPGITLGSATIAPVNMANAYASIANGGQAADVFVIDRVVDREGKEIYKHRVETDEAISEDIAADVTYAMQQVVKSGTGTAASALGRPVAGKTGTATAQNKTGKDHVSGAWFVGFTPQLSTAVMYVRGTGAEPLDDGFLPGSYFGGNFPARTWAAVMRDALEGEEVLSFPPLAYVDGDAPESGHAPQPTKTPKPTCKEDPKQKRCMTATPTKTPTKTPTATTMPTATATPTKNTPPPKDPCTDLVPPPTCEPTPTDSATSGGAGPPGNGNGNPGT